MKEHITVFPVSELNPWPKLPGQLGARLKSANLYSLRLGVAPSFTDLSFLITLIRKAFKSCLFHKEKSDSSELQ